MGVLFCWFFNYEYQEANKGSTKKLQVLRKEHSGGKSSGESWNKIFGKALSWRFGTWIWNARIHEVSKEAGRCCEEYGKVRLFLVVSDWRQNIGKLEKQLNVRATVVLRGDLRNCVWKIVAENNSVEEEVVGEVQETCRHPRKAPLLEFLRLLSNR